MPVFSKIILINLNMKHLTYLCLVFLSIIIHSVSYRKSEQAKILQTTIQNWNPLKCGKTVEEVEKDFTTKALKGQFPWQAIIIERIKNKNHYLCNGVLIHKYFILTGFTCKSNNLSSKLLVILGAYDLVKILRNDTSGCSIYEINKIIYGKKMSNDSHFLLLKLNIPAEEMPVCLTKPDVVNLTKHCYLVGWPSPTHPTLKHIIKKNDLDNVCKKTEHIYRTLTLQDKELYVPIHRVYNYYVTIVFIRLYQLMQQYIRGDTSEDFETEYFKKGDGAKGGLCPARKSLVLRKIPVKYNPRTSSTHLRSLNKLNSSLSELYDEMTIGSSIICRLSIPTKANTCFRKEPLSKFKSWYSVVGLLLQYDVPATNKPINSTDIEDYYDFITDIVNQEI